MKVYVVEYHARYFASWPIVDYKVFSNKKKALKHYTKVEKDEAKRVNEGWNRNYIYCVTEWNI